MFRSLQASIGYPAEPPQEQTLSEELSEMSSLSAKHRLLGFLMAMVMGIAFIVIAMSFVPVIALFPKKFAFFFTCGNLFCVSSTMFLVGPAKQVRSMFEAHRSQAAATYVLTLFMTLVAALQWRSSVLSIVFACGQVAALLWYALSYIPFARRVIGYTWTYALMLLKPICSVLTDMTWRLLKCVCGCSRGGGSSTASIV
jgi:hypothetical protein